MVCPNATINGENTYYQLYCSFSCKLFFIKLHKIFGDQNHTPLEWLDIFIIESERSCICVLGVSVLIYDFDIWFWNCSDSVVFIYFFISLQFLNNAINIKSNVLLSRHMWPTLILSIMFMSVSYFALKIILIIFQ